MDIYNYGKFIIGSYVNEYGIDFLKKFYSILNEARIESTCEPIGIADSWDSAKKKTNQSYDSNCIYNTIADILAEASGKNITRDDILYPYKKLFIENEEEFKKKVLYMD